MGMRFVPSADVYLKNYPFIFYYFIIHVIIRASPRWPFFLIIVKLVNYSANFSVF